MMEQNYIPVPAESRLALTQKRALVPLHLLPVLPHRKARLKIEQAMSANIAPAAYIPKLCYMRKTACAYLICSAETSPENQGVVKVLETKEARSERGETNSGGNHPSDPPQ